MSFINDAKLKHPELGLEDILDIPSNGPLKFPATAFLATSPYASLRGVRGLFFRSGLPVPASLEGGNIIASCTCTAAHITPYKQICNLETRETSVSKNFDFHFV